MPKQLLSTPSENVSLVAAAARARVKYARMLNHVLCGDVSGHQEDGRWFVDAADLDRFLRDRNDRPLAA